MACFVCELVLYPGVRHIREKKKRIKIKQRATIGMYPHPPLFQHRNHPFRKLSLSKMFLMLPDGRLGTKHYRLRQL